MKVFVLAFLSIISLASTAQATLYGGIGNGSGINPGGLITVDQNNGSGVFVADPISPGGLSGIAFNSSGRLFGTTISGFGSTSNFVELDPVTGALISSVPLGISIGDLAIQPGTDVIYGIQSNADGGDVGGRVYTIDTAGIATQIGNTHEGRGGGLAFDNAGGLWFLEFNQMHQLNPANGSVLNTTILSQEFGDGLAVRPTDGLFFSTANRGGNEIFTLDPNNSFSGTVIGSTGIGAASDLAFSIIPEPSTIVPAALGFVGVVCRRRKRT